MFIKKTNKEKKVEKPKVIKNKKSGRPKGSKNKEYSEDQRQKNRRGDISRRALKNHRENKETILYTGLFIAIISLIGLLIVGSMGNKLKSDFNLIKDEVSEKINATEEKINTAEEKINDLTEKVDTTQQHISAIIDLSLENGEKIRKVEKYVTHLETRVVTAQKGVNRLARIQLINLGYEDSLSFAIANEISVNPTNNKWDKLISNSKFKLKKLNEDISDNKVNITEVNQKVSDLQKLLDKKHQIVLKLLKNHGTKEMKKQFNK